MVVELLPAVFEAEIRIWNLKVVEYPVAVQEELVPGLNQEPDQKVNPNELYSLLL